MDAQLPIKILIIIVLVGFVGFLLLPSRGSRSSAIRSIILMFMAVFAVFAVVFPSLLSSIAGFLGVGRGTDLLLYGFIFVLIGQMLTTSRRRRSQELQITKLARREAIHTARLPAQRG